MNSIFNNQRGQSMVLTVLFLTVLLAMAAAVLDVGSWYRADRQLQATADAAALAGAQALPENSGEAGQLALEYSDKNGGGLTAENVRFSTGLVPGDTIAVQLHRSAPGLFTRIVGIDSVNVGARATARASNLGQARWVAPIVVNYLHPMLQCKPLPCFGQPTTIDLHRHFHTARRPGAFGLVNLDLDDSGHASTPVLADWIRNGFDKYLPLADYHSASGAEFNSTQVKQALTARLGDELLFPVYRNISGGGVNLVYEIIGWVGFTMTSFDAQGQGGKLEGTFTRVIWEGIQSTSSQQADFGARTISLVE